MNENQKNWAFVICLIVVPFTIVHLFANEIVSRLVSVLWVDTIFPAVIVFLVFYTKQTIRLKNYSNQVVEKRITIGVKFLTLLMAIAYFLYLSVPSWSGVYNVYLQNRPFVIVEDSVSRLSSVVFAPGLYLGVTLSGMPNDSYTYLFPTTYKFGDSVYKFTILPGTNTILKAEPLQGGD